MSKEKKETILEKAERIVMKDREEMYGHPKDNHGCTAAMWTAYIIRKLEVTGPGREFSFDAEDVCFLNILQKISRCANTITKDNLVDIAGWARCVERIMDGLGNKDEDEGIQHAFIANVEGGQRDICERCRQPKSHHFHYNMARHSVEAEGNRV